jgi:hypothetical protein
LKNAQPDHAKQNEIAEAKLRTARKGGTLLLEQPGLGSPGGGPQITDRPGR